MLLQCYKITQSICIYYAYDIIKQQWHFSFMLNKLQHVLKKTRPGTLFNWVAWRVL